MIVLASRAPAVRRRWRTGLRRFSIGEAADRPKLAALLAGKTPSVVLVDVALLGPRGAGDVSALRRLSPASRFIVVSSAPAEREGLAAFRAGARGYCHRDLDPALLPKAIEVVQKGEIWAGRALVARLVEDLGRRTTRRAENGARVAALGEEERNRLGADWPEEPRGENGRFGGTIL